MKEEEEEEEEERRGGEEEEEGGGFERRVGEGAGSRQGRVSRQVKDE